MAILSLPNGLISIKSFEGDLDIFFLLKHEQLETDGQVEKNEDHPGVWIVRDATYVIITDPRAATPSYVAYLSNVYNANQWM